MKLQVPKNTQITGCHNTTIFQKVQILQVEPNLSHCCLCSYESSKLLSMSYEAVMLQKSQNVGEKKN